MANGTGIHSSAVQPLLATQEPSVAAPARSREVHQNTVASLGRRSDQEYAVRQDLLKKGRAWMLKRLSNILRKRDQEHDINRCFDLLENRLEQEMKLFNSSSCGPQNLPDSEHRALILGRCDDVEDLVVGPAVPYAYWSNGVTWAGFLLCTFFACYCTGIDDETGLASSVFMYPGFAAFLVLVWLACTAAPMWWEMKAFVYVLVSQVSVVGVPRLMGPKSVDKFLVFLAIISFLLHTDILTTAMFMARVFKSTHSCNVEWNLAWFVGADEKSPLEDMWAHTIHESSNGRQFEGMKFWQWTFFAWLFMLFQLAYALMYSVPTSPDFQNSGYPKYVLVEGTCEEEGFPPFVRLRSEYNTFGAMGMGHGRCVQALADSGRMITMQWLDDDYQAKVVHAWTNKKLAAEMVRANWRFVLFSIQGIVIPSLQITYFGAMKARYKTAPYAVSLFGDLFVVASIVISVLAGAKYIAWEVTTALKHVAILRKRLDKKAYDRERRILKMEQDMVPLDRPHTRAQWEYNKFIAWGIFSMVLNVILAFSATIAFAYILVKAVMEMMVCDALWNMPDFFTATQSFSWWSKPFHYLLHLRDGCVDPTFQERDLHWNGGWKDCNTTYTAIMNR